jgi:hypothetical protein
MREKTVEAYLVRRSKEEGDEVRKVQFIGHRGAPDRLLLVRKIWVELKTPGKRAEPHQLREHARLRKAGWRVEVVDSFERVDEVLK